MKKKLVLITLITVVMLFLSACSRKYDFSDVKKGDVITFGKYEQDNDSSNGAEPIEWKVLNVDKENGKALIISKKAIEAFTYNRDEDSKNWQDCLLRKWLNNDFYDQAFDDDEKDYIIESATETENDSSSGILGSKSITTDKVFLLSDSDISKYGKLIGTCYPTDYVDKKVREDIFYNYSFYDDEGCSWYLLEPGSHISIKKNEISWGHINTRGLCGVCPVLYIKLK